MKRKRKRRFGRRFVVSVTDFGAIGDGFADDSEAFATAKQTRALIIKIPAGVWMVQGVELDHRFVGVSDEL